MDERNMQTKLTQVQELSANDVSLHVGSKVLDKLYIPPKDKRELASNLVTLRTEADISQSDLAEVFSISQSAIGNWESVQVEGRVPPPYAVMLLASLFDCPVETFVLAGDPMINRLNSQLRAVLKIKAHSCSTYEIREVFKTPSQVTKLAADSAQNTKDIRQIESTIACLMTDVNLLKQELERLKQGANLAGLNQSTSLTDATGGTEALTETLVQSAICKLPFGKMMEDMGFNFTGALNNMSVEITEPMLLLDTTYSNVQPSIAVYDPRITKLDSLDGKLAVVENSFGAVCVREIRNVRGRFFACAVTSLGIQEMQDIEVQELKVLGKLTAIIKVIPDDM